MYRESHASFLWPGFYIIDGLILPSMMAGQSCDFDKYTSRRDASLEPSLRVKVNFDTGSTPHEQTSRCEQVDGWDEQQGREVLVDEMKRMMMMMLQCAMMADGDGRLSIAPP